MTSPAPSEGEEPLDAQSETVSPPVRDEAPPTRTRRTPAVAALLVAAWLVLGAALVWIVVARLV
jgi:hypothetical protein